MVHKAGPLPLREHLQRYVAFCPSCGQPLAFSPGCLHGDNYSVSAGCPACSKRWSMIFDIDPSGTFGVMSFQCDNEDRIL